jgi:predicted nucleotide-binding protein
VQWLREQVPDSGLADELLEQRVASAHRCLRALNRAKELLPFLRDDFDTKLPKPENVRKVFVVHGHDGALKNAVARLLEKLELQPVILHEQPNKGRTIIEKFLDYADVAFAVVLLTPDDLGGMVAGDPSKFKPRARQNVILELGFFLGKLTRQRVAAIYSDGVELPSDYSGVLFIPYDAGGAWQYQIAKELKAAGVRIDLNKI